jgi:hypothetical protein
VVLQPASQGFGPRRAVQQRCVWLGLLVCGLAAGGALAQPVINEILFNPPGTDLPNEYIELRGTPNTALPNGTWLVVVEGDTTANPGSVQNIFPLSGRVIGGNGFLVLLQKTNAYSPISSATALVNTGSGAGWGDDQTSSLGHRGEGGQTDLENGSQTFFLIQTASPPSLSDDIDADDNGVPDGAAFTGWTILDSVGVMDADGDVGYGAINFRRNVAGIASGTIVAVTFNPDYVGRSGNTTGSAAADWVAGAGLGGSAPNWSLSGNTVPAGFAGQLLNHLGGPNFGAPAIAGVVALPTGGRTVVPEGSGTDSYTLALNTAPSGNVTIQITGAGQLQVSVDGGASFGSTRSVVFNSTAPRAVHVRTAEDNVLDVSPRTERITHAITATADPANYPVGKPTPTVDVDITETDWLLLSELKVNPPGGDAPYEFLELRGAASLLLRNVYVVVMQGEAGAGLGTASEVFRLDSVAVGSSELLVIAGAGHPYPIPAGTIVLTNTAFNQSGGVLPNGSVSFVLFTSRSNVQRGDDLARNNNTELNLPDDATLLDAVGWRDGDAGDVVYGGVELTQPNGAPDAATRFAYNETPLSAAAWFNGDLAGVNGDSVIYDGTNVSANFPMGTTLSPGVFINSAPSISPLGPFSGVIGDPTNPALAFTVNDAETDPAMLTVTARSSNSAVVPNARLTLTNAGSGNWRLSLDPVGVGYATITITVSDDDETGTLSFPYAASTPSRTNTSQRAHTGASDGSAAIALDADLMLVGDDENQTLRLYRRNQSGGPLRGFDFNPFLGLTDLYDNGVPKEVDIEAATRVGNRLYWIGGHSHGSLAQGANEAVRTNRARLFATDLSGTGTNATLTFVGRYDFLKVDLINWDARNEHGQGSNYYGLAASAAVGVDSKAPDGSGFNIEGLCMAPGSSNVAYLGFRAPFIPPTNRLKALIVPVTNFDAVAISTGPPGTARFGPPLELDLDGRGIRSIEGGPNGYLIVAGPPDVATEIPPKDFRLFTWTGNPGDQPQQRAADLSGMIPEAIVELPPGPWTTNTPVQLLSDNGITVYYGDGLAAKQLPYPAFKKFRTDWVTLGPVVVPPPVIRSISVSGTNLVLAWKASIGYAYRVRHKSTLTQTNWLDIAGDVLATDVIAHKTVPLDAGTQRFFQVMRVP